MPETTDLRRGIYRRIYGGFITGRRINTVSLAAEAWFWRINAVVDDFGNAHADPMLLRNATAGRRQDVTADQVAAWLGELADAGLVLLYEAGNEQYLHVVDFETIQPAGKNGKRIQKHPPPPGCIQVNPDESGGEQAIPDVPGKSCASHSHTQDHSHSETQNSCPEPPPAAASGQQRQEAPPEPSGQPTPSATPDAPPLPQKAAKPPDTSPVLMTFPTKGSAREWPLHESLVLEMQKVYSVDVRAQCDKARLWCLTKPAKQKTPRGMPSFLNGWMERAQNDSRNPRQPERNRPDGPNAQRPAGQPASFTGARRPPRIAQPAAAAPSIGP